MTFRQYLAIRRVSDSLAGDFTIDARMDPSLPDATTWHDLRSYIESRADVSLTTLALDGAYQVWRGYQSFRQKGSDKAAG